MLITRPDKGNEVLTRMHDIVNNASSLWHYHQIRHYVGKRNFKDFYVL